jgi:DNA repair exonuclease SbcCD ATPase subunit
MRLKLKNFRCYTEQDFDFGDNGLLLLSGASGKGKSSVLLAINFVLYGTGTKLITYGKSACKVELWFDDFHIVRTKRPNRLVLNDIHEDASAQAMIDKKFGKTFDVTGYIAQNALNSFVLMSPMEKLAFLERFAFSDVDLTKLKHKCRELIKKRNEQLIAANSQLEMATHVLGEMEEPEEVPYPLKPTKNRDKAMKNESIRLKNSETLIRRAQHSVAKLHAEKASLNVLDAKTKVKNAELRKVVDKLDDLQFEHQTTDYDGDETLAEYEEQLLTLVSQRELQLLEQRYEDDQTRLEEMIQTEVQEMEEKLEVILAGLWQEYTESEVKTTISEYKQLLKDVKALENLRESLRNYSVDEEKLEGYKEELKTSKKKLDAQKELLTKLKMQQELYTCPVCDQSLRFHDDALHTAEEDDELDELDVEDLTRQISVAQRRVNKLEYMIPQEQNCLDRHNEISLKIQGIVDQYDDELPPVSEIENDLDYIKDYKRAQSELEKQKKELEKSLKEENYSAAVVSFQDSMKKQKKKIRSLKKKQKNSNCDDIDEMELRQTIQIQKRNKEKLDDLDTRIKVLIHERSTYQSQIIKDKEEHIGLYKKIRDISAVDKAMTKRKDEIVALEAKKDKHAKNVQKIEVYKNYLKEQQRYQEWIEKVQDQKETEELCRRKYAAATILKEKILEAESIAMLNIINSINSHVQEYLDLFFAVDPISARLLPYKETKKSKKPQINIQIEYKGMEADLNMLSGGELSRVILAFTLGLGEIFNTPLMLLDECTSSLDQELTTQVIDGIRENYGDKMVIVIAHQVVSGHFDRVLRLE